MIYRRRKKSDVWHFSGYCHHWPAKDYIELDCLARPANGELCNECLAKRRKNRIAEKLASLKGGAE